MKLVYLMLANLIILGIGMHYKIQNDSYDRNPYKVDKNSNKYLHFIDKYAKRLIRGKKITQSQRRLLVDFILDNNDDELNRINRKMLNDDGILIAQFNVERYEPFLKKLKRKATIKNNKYKEENNMYSGWGFEDNENNNYGYTLNNKGNHATRCNKRVL